MGHVLRQGRRSSIQKQTSDPVREQIPSSLAEKGLLFQDKHKVDHDEIVKHMSNLPGFLQKEKKNNVQEKALNFGVLNWKHLEKWKYNERMPTTHNKKTSSRFVSPQRHPPPPRSSHLNSLQDDIKSKGKETCSQESQDAQGNSIHSQQDDFHRKITVYDTLCSKTNVDKSNIKDPKKEATSEKQASSLDKIKVYGTLCSKTNVDKSKIKDPKKEATSEREASSLDKIKVYDTLISKTNVDKSKMKDPKKEATSEKEASSLDKINAQENKNETRSDDVLDPPNMSTIPFLGSNSECKFSRVHEKTRRPSFSFEASLKPKDEIFERPSAKERFSFDLGKMGRSFSFKESSEAPQSGLVGPKISSVMDNFERETANGSSRRRSSPLRRLLDPFMKHNKGSQSAETVRPPSNRSLLDSVNFKNTKGSTSSQALLQLTVKNGIPSFKLVVNNSSDMLAAVVKRLPAHGKTDSCMIYAFYSVQEIRKKSTNWITQGSNGNKNKNCSLGYNVVGHMKISNTYHPRLDSSSGGICVVARECVLYGVDDEQNLECLSNKEVAAIVIEKTPSEKVNRTVVVLPGGAHGVPINGSHSSLISRWRSGGSCDCGGWDVGCHLRIFTDYGKGSDILDRVDLFVQGGESKAVFSLEPFSNGFYSIELDASVSLLEAFATCVACVTCGKFIDILDTNDHRPDEERFPKYVSCPPLSPAGRI